MKAFVRIGICSMVLATSGCLTNSHFAYLHRAAAAKMPKPGTEVRPGRIYFVSFPENNMALSFFGWHPNIGHAALVTNDGNGRIRQYDYGWFVGGEHLSQYVIGYAGDCDSYGVVQLRSFPETYTSNATNYMEVARMVLSHMPNYGDMIEVWAKNVDDVGIAERYMDNFANDKDRGSMAWRCWQIGGYRCGNIARQAFDAARGEGHYLDLLWGGFPGADAPSIGTEKTVYRQCD